MFTSVFLLNIVYFSVCLTSNKLYWIDDQLASVSTQFYTLASWRRRVGVGELASASWSVGKLTVIPHINPSGPAHISFHYSLLWECLLGAVQVTISNKYYFTWKRVCSGIALQLLRSRSNIHTKEKENITLR